MSAALPDGPLVAFYGDDYTGSAATMEVLTFAGLPSVLFLDPPTTQQMAEFSDMRGIGLAGTARSQSPEWMDDRLPDVFHWLKSVGAKVAHYKICSTFDSSPTIGSIGKALDIAAAHFNGFMPMLVAAPAMRRYQAFGNLFASSPSGVARLDRHSIMARHLVTPMNEADVRLVLAEQTKQKIGLITVEDFQDAESARQAVRREVAKGIKIISLDTVSQADIAQAGGLIWENAAPDMLAVGSQGVEYAIVAYLRELGLLQQPDHFPSVGKAKQMIAVSGSTSAITAAQIDHAAANGFAAMQIKPSACLGDAAAFNAAFDAALNEISSGRDVLVYSAKGPDDVALGQFAELANASGLTPHDANQMLGASLGKLLAELLKKTNVTRAAISGGDTSGHATRQLGIYALTALAPTLPGASLCLAHSSNGEMHGLQLALKGGQMGSEDYFDWIRQGGGSRQA
jgi:3-oxoisoapionate kinase